MKIGYIAGFWATNIGNSFYNLGALYLLKKIFGEQNVFFIPDPPQWLWNVNNEYDFIMSTIACFGKYRNPGLDPGILPVQTITKTGIKCAHMIYVAYAP